MWKDKKYVTIFVNVNVINYMNYFFFLSSFLPFSPKTIKPLKFLMSCHHWYTDFWPLEPIFAVFSSLFGLLLLDVALWVMLTWIFPCTHTHAHMHCIKCRLYMLCCWIHQSVSVFIHFFNPDKEDSLIQYLHIYKVTALCFAVEI